MLLKTWQPWVLYLIIISFSFRGKIFFATDDRNDPEWTILSKDLLVDSYWHLFTDRLIFDSMILQKEIFWLILDSLVPNDQIVQEVRQLVHTYHIVCVIKETLHDFTIRSVIRESVNRATPDGKNLFQWKLPSKMILRISRP